MNYEYCKIGQLSRCNSTGCEWKKAFGGYCNHRPTIIEQKFLEERNKKETIKTKPIKINFELTKEEPNPFKISAKDLWIGKIKTI